MGRTRRCCLSPERCFDDWFRTQKRPAVGEAARFSLHGGAGQVAQACAQDGASAVVVDLSDHTENDLARPKMRQAVLALMRRFSAVGVDLPCTTWSRARRAPRHSSMLCALCGDEGSSLYGLPGLSERDVEKLRTGNCQGAFARAIVARSIALNQRGT